MKLIKNKSYSKRIRQILCLTVIAFSLSISSTWANFTVKFPDGTSKKFKTKTISEIKYISLEQAGDILFFEKEYTIEKEVLFCKNNYLVALDGSFFFDFSKHCQSYTVQMFMPIKQHKGITYLPCEEFLIASIKSGVLNAKYNENVLTIEPYSLVELETYDFNTFDVPGIPVITPKGGILHTGTYNGQITNSEHRFPILSTYTIKQLQINLPTVEPDYEEMLKLKYERRKAKRPVPPNVFQIPEEIKNKEATANKSK